MSDSGMYKVGGLAVSLTLYTFEVLARISLPSHTSTRRPSHRINLRSRATFTLNNLPAMSWSPYADTQNFRASIFLTPELGPAHCQSSAVRHLLPHIVAYRVH